MSIESPGPWVRRVARRHDAPHFVLYAGFVSRAIAATADLLAIFTFWVVGRIATTFIGQTSGISQIAAFLQGFFSWITPLQQFLVSAAFELIILLTLGFCYFAFFYAFGGATPGKYLMGLQVVRTDGKPLSGTQAALRTLAYAASSLPVYMGFFNVLLDDRRRAYHDILTKTAVVHSWPARADETFLRHAIERVNRRG
jgi:uncharacterized RDD family membrane protein YckC